MYIVPISQLPAIGEAAQRQTQVGAGTQGIPFANVLSDAVRNLQETQAASQKSSYDLAMGNVDDLHNVQIASMKASAAVEFTAGLTGRVLSAYNEIMRIQI